jgi:hypothetical protein
MENSGFVAIIALLSMIVIATIAGFVIERHFTRVSWVIAYIAGASISAIFSIALFFGLTWLDWYLLDSRQAALIAAGTITDISPSRTQTTYEVDLPNGASARIVRFKFDPRMVGNIRLGIITGMVLGAIMLVSRGIVHWRGHRRRLNNSGIEPRTGP